MRSLLLRQRLVRLVVAAVCLSYPAVASAAPRIILSPVELLGYTKQQAIRISVELPCGAEFYGLVAKSEKNGAELKLAAAVTQNNIVCTALPAPREIVVDYIHSTGFKVIAPMTISGAAPRVAIARIKDLRLLKEKRGTRLRAAFETRCGSELGTLIRKTSSNRLEIAIAERAPSAWDTACDGKEIVRSVRAIDPKAKYQIARLKEKRASLRRAYYLRLARIDSEALASRSDKAAKGLGVRYQRGCDEAPVGIVIAREVQGGTERIKVGMLVARYYNHTCHASSAPTWDVFVDSGLRIPTSATIVGLAATSSDMDELTVIKPHKVTRSSLGGAQGVKVTYTKSCDVEIGAVFARDAGGKLSVATVARATNVDTLCTTRPTEVSLFQPVISGDVKPHDLSPMRLSGWAAH